MSRDIDIAAAPIAAPAISPLPDPSRPLDPGMGVAVGRRTVFRPSDQEDFGRVADRVAHGSMSLTSDLDRRQDLVEMMRLRNAIASGSLLTSGRHLQHGDAEQATRNIEVFTNCATACSSFAKFYLLLNGSGVGRSYDDELMVVDWTCAPRMLVHIPASHPDCPRTAEQWHALGREIGVPRLGATIEDSDMVTLQITIDRLFLLDLDHAQDGWMIHQVDDSREGWAEAVEVWESLAHDGQDDVTLVLDLSQVRPLGAPIAGMQGRPASGPLSLARALMRIQLEVVDSDRDMPLWEQALRVDHHLSVEVQVGGARRAARMSTKSWRDPGILDFVRIKERGGLWTSNHSVMVDQDFWRFARSEDVVNDPLCDQAHAVFDEVIRCSYATGEPGMINGDLLEDHRTGSAWLKPVHSDGRDFQSRRYSATAAAGMMREVAERASRARYPVTTNPCGEITLHVTGGYCVIADFAPVLACPSPLELAQTLTAEDLALWDRRVEESIRLGIRMLIRTNTMDALYGEEIRRTNRIGIGPTGLHEWMWLRWGVDFRRAISECLDDFVVGEMWTQISDWSRIAKEEAVSYSRELGVAEPTTVTTVKPAGTTSKLFGLTEGAHLPARRYYLRWVQLRSDDPLVARYEEMGYPIKPLRTFPGMIVVGFPTVPLLMRLGIGDLCVTATEATLEEQYRWLQLLEECWIGEERGNQVSYTMKLLTTEHDVEDYARIVLENQPHSRCCTIMPTRPDSELPYEYLPEEEISLERLIEVMEQITDPSMTEVVDMDQLRCASGVCPV